MTPAHPSLPLSMFFAFWPALLATGLISAVRGVQGPSRKLMFGLFAWFALTGALARFGVLHNFELVPPPLLGLTFFATLASVTLATSQIGTRLISGLPPSAIVGLQVFRLPLEVAMHRAAREGVMPVQMSFAGWNFDILTGLSALVLAAILRRRKLPLAVLHVWNCLGLALLVNIVVIAIASTPLFKAFGDTPEVLNTFVTDPPFVWLPTFLVPLALFGHVLLFRSLRAEGRK